MSSRNRICGYFRFSTIKFLLFPTATILFLTIWRSNGISDERTRAPLTITKGSLKHVLYKKRPETAHINCGRILRGDKVLGMGLLALNGDVLSYLPCVAPGCDYKSYMEQIAQHRPVFVSRKMGYSCEEVQDRILPKYPMEKIEHGVAHARVVYKDYEFIEEELRSNYHWQNHFCYTLDSKSSPNFRIKIRQLPVCLRNVYVVSEEFNIDSWGKSMNKAHFECLKFLIKKQGWNYVLLLQNYDVIIKSVYEIVEIYRLLSGANDVEIVRAPLDLRIRHRRRWDAKSLNLFPEASKSKENATLRFAKGVVQASLSRAAVDWMVNRVNLTTLIENINQEPFSDELLIQSLQITDEFDMPGRFSYECSQTGPAGTITRLTHWIMGSPNDCLSGHVRHDICIMGVEHIPELSRTPHILVNKMMPDFDYGAIECVHELVFNRTFRNQVDHALNRSHYSNLAHVIYHKNRHDPSWLSSLNCSNLVRPYRRLLPKSFPERDY